MMHIHRFSCGALCRRVAPPLRHSSLTPPLLPTSPALSFRLSFCSYVRFNTRLDACAYKEIWKAFDTSEGVEVAWNTLFLEEVPRSDKKRCVSTDGVAHFKISKLKFECIEIGYFRLMAPQDLILIVLTPGHAPLAPTPDS